MSNKDKYPKNPKNVLVLNEFSNKGLMKEKYLQIHSHQGPFSIHRVVDSPVSPIVHPDHLDDFSFDLLFAHFFGFTYASAFTRFVGVPRENEGVQPKVIFP